jgi:drug/metabolite transporter (DMT)-like permease
MGGLVTASSRGAALALMIIAPVLWSSAGVVARHIERAEPFEQVFWRSLFAFVFVFAVLLFQKTNPWRALRGAGVPGLVSGLMWALMFTAFLFALSLTTTANTLVVMSVSPLLTAVFASLFLKDPVPLRTWIAAGAAAIGIAWMFGSSLEKHFLGMAIAFLIPVAAAINFVVVRASATKRDVALLDFLGVFQLGLPCMLLVLASRSLLAPEIALLGLLEVVLGPLWTWLFAGEEPGAATLVGGAVVLGALVANEVATMLTATASKPSPSRIRG